ncbi:uncharacterized protein GIQ15_04298 [Arthroderma uncinatum]|uniref:uncharacterized protein n=1 Tax=Arthroderma uncinatum TaxID=74035 RepID=UPI00144AEE09|nr:uncharacterized protein GIQ15_04298 [Arthroderma uncinatum]KAF3481539.1 hypothetical protein GIQ15_04298 [Arthroderma uncinatum]
MWGGTTTRSRLRQTISSLWHVNEVPETPRENFVTSTTDVKHRLSFSREKEIVSNLAFLSAVSDDNLRVMAVCIEEYSNGEGITIRIASNTGDLSEVTAGFKKLGKILMQAARRERPRTEDIGALFGEVIALDIFRILSRLRSRHAESKRSFKKPAIILQLQEVIKDRSIGGGISPSLKAEVESLRDLFFKLERLPSLNSMRAQAHELLGRIVRKAYDLTLVTDLSNVFQGSKLDPSLLMHLPVAIGKLGRYYSAASELVCAARNKQCPVFHDIRVEPFEVNKPGSIPEIGRIHAEGYLF